MERREVLSTSWGQKEGIYRGNLWIIPHWLDIKSFLLGKYQAKAEIVTIRNWPPWGDCIALNGGTLHSFFLKTELPVAQTGYKVALQSRMTLNPWSSCLCLPHTGTANVCHHTWLAETLRFVRRVQSEEANEQVLGFPLGRIQWAPTAGHFSVCIT